MVEIEDQNYFTISEVAKIINAKDLNGITIGRNKFFQLLRVDGVLLDNNFPSQYFLNLDLFKMHAVHKSGKTYFIPVVSEKGLAYLTNKYKNITFVTEKKPLVKHSVNLSDVV